MSRLIAGRPRSFVIDDVTWDYYDRTLHEFERQGKHTRVSYDDGRMELMTVGDAHERIKKALARLLELYALEQDIPITGLGSITCRRKALRKGTEPDECYYVQTPAPPMSRKSLDLAKYPPPDLVVEVDIAAGSVKREPIYHAMGVKEVWRLDGERIIPMHRTEDGYEPVDASLAFPELSMKELSRFLRIAITRSQHDGVRAFRDWLRAR